MKGEGLNKFVKGLILPLVVLTWWHLGSSWGNLNPYLLPAPGRVLEVGVVLIKGGTLAQHVGASLYRVLGGFFLALVLAFPLGILVGLFKDLKDFLDPTLEFIRHIPPIAIIPMLILWLGIGEAPKITVIVLASFFPIFLNTLNGIINCDKKLMEVGESFGFSSWETVTKILLPSALPSVVVGMRLGLGYSWRALIGAELIAAASGVGYMILEAEQLSRPDIILVGIFTLGLMGLILDLGFTAISHRWAKRRGWEDVGD